MHIAKQTVHIEVEITIGFHFEVFRMVNLVPQTARYRSTVKFSLVALIGQWSRKDNFLDESLI